MKMTSKSMAAVILVILFGGIAVTTALGWWATETTKEPARFSEGEAAGEYNPLDIRGSYTFGDISRLFEIPIEDLARAFQVPQGVDPASFQVKNLEDQFAAYAGDLGTSSVRLFTAFYTGLPYDLTLEEVYLPDSAAAVLLAKAPLNEEQKAYLAAHTVITSEVSTPPAAETVAASTPAPAATETHTVEEGKVAGKTTFQDLLDWGVPKEVIEQIMGGMPPTTSTLVKDYCTLKGLSFSEIKLLLQAEVDKALKK